jgi:hypothetical protein
MVHTFLFILCVAQATLQFPFHELEQFFMMWEPNICIHFYFNGVWHTPCNGPTEHKETWTQF